MNTIQKATFAAGALAITLLGAALVTAPIAFARPVATVAHNDCVMAALQPAGPGGCAELTADARLVALNRR